jgi:hypothetical protein
MNTFRTVHPEMIIAALRAAGYQAEACEPPTRYMNGCSDPWHCQQHPLSHRGRDGVVRPVVGVRTDASGHRYNAVATRAWAALLAGGA